MSLCPLKSLRVSGHALHDHEPRVPDHPSRDYREQAPQRRAGPYQEGAGQGGSADEVNFRCTRTNVGNGLHN